MSEPWFTIWAAITALIGMLGAFGIVVGLAAVVLGVIWLLERVFPGRTRL